MPFNALASLTFLISPNRFSKAPTIVGWTPGLRRLVAGRLLPCGCLVGTYETWANAVVTIIEIPADTCGHRDHVVNALL